MKIQHLWWSRLCLPAKVRSFLSYIVPVLTDDGWLFRYLRRAMGVRASFCSHTTNQSVWSRAGKPIVPLQVLLQLQQQCLIHTLQKPHHDPLFHVVFSPGYKDRIKFTKSKHRGHPRPYWFDIVSKQSVVTFGHFPGPLFLKIENYGAAIHCFLLAPADCGDAHTSKV